MHQHELSALLPEVTLGDTPIQIKSDVHAAELGLTSQKVEPAKIKPKDNIAVPINMLDELSQFSGEITVIRNMVNKLVRALEIKYIGN